MSLRKSCGIVGDFERRTMTRNYAEGIYAVTYGYLLVDLLVMTVCS